MVRKVKLSPYMENKLISRFNLRWGFCMPMCLLDLQFNADFFFFFSEEWYTESGFQILCQLKRLF